MEVTETKDEVAEAQALLQAKENEKIKAFQKEYQELAQKYGYGMSPIVQITASGVEANLTIVKL